MQATQAPRLATPEERREILTEAAALGERFGYLALHAREAGDSVGYSVTWVELFEALGDVRQRMDELLLVDFCWVYEARDLAGEYLPPGRAYRFTLSQELATLRTVGRSSLKPQ